MCIIYISLDSRIPEARQARFSDNHNLYCKDVACVALGPQLDSLDVGALAGATGSRSVPRACVVIRSLWCH
jgi:hypothetical protein